MKKIIIAGLFLFTTFSYSQFNQYVPQLPVNAMRDVGVYKQRIYDQRKDWIQGKIYELNDLINNLFNKQNLPSLSIEETRNIYFSKLNKYVNSISGDDYGDDYQFRNVVEGFNSLENGFYKNYNSCIENEKKYYLDKQAKEQSESQLGKLGIRFEETGNNIQITEIIYGGAAWKSNQLENGDKIIKIAQGENSLINVEGMSSSEVRKLITGTKGTMVRLTILKRDYSYKTISLFRE